MSSFLGRLKVSDRFLVLAKSNHQILCILSENIVFQKVKLANNVNDKWYFVTKIVLTYCEKIFSSYCEKLLKFEAEGQEFSKIVASSKPHY